MKDEFQSPYTYEGISPSFEVAYASVTPKGKHGIDITYSRGKIQSVVSPLADNRILLRNYSYLANLTRVTTNRKFSFSAGPGIQAFLGRTNYLPDIELSKKYLSASVYLLLDGDMTYCISDRSALTLRMSIPVFGISYRPDFEINGESLTTAATPVDGILFSARLQYVYRLNPRTDLIIAYRFNYFGFNKPRPINAMSNGLLIGVKRKF